MDAKNRREVAAKTICTESSSSASKGDEVRRWAGATPKSNSALRRASNQNRRKHLLRLWCSNFVHREQQVIAKIHSLVDPLPTQVAIEFRGLRDPHIHALAAEMHRTVLHICAIDREPGFQGWARSGPSADPQFDSCRLRTTRVPSVPPDRTGGLGRGCKTAGCSVYQLSAENKSATLVALSWRRGPRISWRKHSRHIHGK